MAERESKGSMMVTHTHTETRTFSLLLSRTPPVRLVEAAHRRCARGLWYGERKRNTAGPLFCFSFFHSALKVESVIIK